jgi:hypothetical protein
LVTIPSPVLSRSNSEGRLINYHILVLLAHAAKLGLSGLEIAGVLARPSARSPSPFHNLSFCELAAG